MHQSMLDWTTLDMCRKLLAFAILLYVDPLPTCAHHGLDSLIVGFEILTTMNNAQYKMLISLWLYLLFFTFPSWALPNPNSSISISPLDGVSSANLSWPFILPYSWDDRETGLHYKLGFSMRRVSLDRTAPHSVRNT